MIKIMEVPSGNISTKIVKCPIGSNQTIIYPGTKKQQAAIAVRFNEYCTHLNLPKDFRLKFPYLFAVIRDMYVSNLVNKRNNQAMEKHLKYLISLINYLTGALFALYDLLGTLPDIHSFFQSKENKSKKDLLQAIERLLEPLCDPRSEWKKILIVEEEK